MNGRFSLQRRLGLGVALLVAVTWLVATACGAVVIRHELDETFDSALQETAQRLLPLAVIDITERDRSLGPRRVSPLARHEEFLTYVVRDRSGEVLLQSHDADLRVFRETPGAGFQSTATHRLYGESALNGAVIIEVAERLDHRGEATLEAALTLLLPLAALVPASLLGAWLLVRLSLRSLSGFTAAVEARGAGNLDPVPLSRLPSEIQAIGESVNQLIGRLRRVLEAERNFASNSAHELRTPLAAALAQTQRLVAETPAGPLNRRARRIEASLGQLARLSEKLLQLARAEGGGILAEGPQALAPVLRHVVDDLRRSEPGGERLQVSTPPSESHGSRLDPDVFAILARNLIENALKHGALDRPVVASLSADGLFRVVNGGRVLAPETLSRVRRRFERGETPAEGAGLGLTIADLVAAAAGASLEIRSPASGQSDGFEASVDLARP